MADFQQNFLASLGAGYKFGQQIKQQRDQSQLNQLAAQSYSAPREQREAIGSRIASLSPDAAIAQKKAWAADDESDQKELMGMARFIKAAPPEQQQKAYQNAVLPRLRARGMDAPDWTPETQGTILQTVDALASAFNGGKANNPYDGLPADIQSLQLLRDNPALAKMDIERRQAGGMVPKLVQTAQGYGWGTPGGGVQLAPLEGVAGQDGAPQPQVQPPQLFAALGQKYGIQPTSVRRTPKRNDEVGGVANSYHLTGQAADWAVPQQYKAQFMADARANGFEAIDEGDHIHIEPAPRGGNSGGIAQPYRAPAAAPSGYRETADGGLEPIAGGPADRSAPPSNAEQAQGEMGMRKELAARLKDDRSVLSMFKNVQGAASDPSAAGDLSMIFAFMKMLDPGSVVREQEFANAQNAAGVPDRVQNMWNRALSGERLNPTQRADFLAQANSLASAAQGRVTAAAREYQGIADQYGYDPTRATGLADFRDVTGSSNSGPSQQAARPQSEADFNALPAGALYIDPDDGRTYRKR
ncbi:Peptidase M15 [compost metagenome]